MARSKSARDILEAIVAGERDPRALAARAHGNIKGGTAAITGRWRACSWASTIRC